MYASRSTWTKATLALVALTLTVACSGGSNSAGPTAPSTPTQQPGGGTPQSGNVPVSIAGFAFSPSGLTITAGSTVTWTNKDAVTHTATADGAEFDSGNLASGASFSHTFSTKGTFTYHCAIHSSMKGTITVQ